MRDRLHGVRKFVLHLRKGDSKGGGGEYDYKKIIECVYKEKKAMNSAVGSVACWNVKRSQYINYRLLYTYIVYIKFF